VYAGIRVWKRTSAGTETEITAGTAIAIANSGAVNGEGVFTATWTPTLTAMALTDSIVVRVYANIATPPTTERAVYTTEQLGATQLDANQWTVGYYLIRSSAGAGNDRYCWGTTTYNTNIAGFKWTTASSPTDHNTVSWTKSADDGAGANDVMNYKVYCKSTNGPWVSGDLLATVPSGTQTYVDLNKGMADGTLWWYIVRAVDTNSNEDTNTNSKQEPGAATPWQNITVTAGWNLISVNITGTTSMPGALTDLANGGAGLVVWTRAMWYNPNDANDKWKQYNTGWNVALNDLTTVDVTKGVWIYVTTVGDGQICVGGAAYSKPTTTMISLRQGWNLVGFPSDDTTYTLANLQALCPTVTIAEQFDGGQTYLTSAMLPATAFVPDKAYWLYTTGDTFWNKTY
jgi:hypothetical protein